MLFLSRLPAFASLQITPISPSPDCIQSTQVASNHTLLSESYMSILQIQAHTCIFSQDSYIPPFSGVVYATPILTPSPLVFRLTHINPCLPSVIINFNISFPVSLFMASSTHPSPYTPSRWRDFNQLNRGCTCLLFNTFDRIWRVPQQSGGPYLKETQPQCKPETCTGKRNPFTFIW